MRQAENINIFLHFFSENVRKKTPNYYTFWENVSFFAIFSEKDLEKFFFLFACYVCSSVYFRKIIYSVRETIHTI